MTSLSIIQSFVSVAGTDGTITVRPKHIIAMKYASVTFECTSDSSPRLHWWKTISAEGFGRGIVDDNCVNRIYNDFSVSHFQDPAQELYRCDLTVKPTAEIYSYGLTTKYMCEVYSERGDIESAASAVLLYLGKIHKKIRELFAFVFPLTSLQNSREHKAS